MNYLVNLDGGHGIFPITNGKRTPIFPDGTVLYENDFNEDVVMRVYNKLIKIDNVDVALTSEEKYDVPLDVRVERANKAWQDHQNYFGKENSKCILVSIHANAYGNGQAFNNAKGVETYCCSSPPEERVLAETIHKHLKGGTTQIDRGVQEICFAILKGNMTSCLVECAFMTNLDEANLLKQEEFREECANEIVAGILEYFGIEEKKEVGEVRYKKYSDRIHELRGEVKDFGVKIVNKSNKAIEEPNCVNGTFFWHINAKEKYSTSILYADGKLYQAAANHLPYPQSVYIVYKNDTIDMKRIKNISELDLNKVKLVIGGVGIRNTLDSTFRYSPASEGFKGIYADVLRRSNKTFIGYNKRLDKQYLLVLKNVTMAEAINIMTDNSTGEAYDIILMVDGGGSPFLNNETDMIVYGDGRIIHNIIGFNLTES